MNNTSSFQFASKKSILLWIVYTLILFVLEPYLLTHFNPWEACKGSFLCFHPVFILIMIFDFVWLLSAFLVFIPSKNTSNSKVIKFFISIVFSFILISYPAYILEYPFKIYRNSTKPHIEILSPTANQTIETDKAFDIVWRTEKINNDGPIYIKVSGGCEKGCEVFELGPFKNTGKISYTIDSKKAYSGIGRISIHYPNIYGGLSGGEYVELYKNPQEAMATIDINVINQNK